MLALTGTGDRFMTDIADPSLGEITKPAAWDRTISEGRRVLQRLVGLELPIVAAVNGPPSVHSEYVLLADMVIAAETAVFSDFPQPPDGRGRPTRHSAGGSYRGRSRLSGLMAVLTRTGGARQ